jgi:hypothetical protein
MTSHPTAAAVQEKASWALKTIIFGSDARRQVAVDAGALQAVERARHRFPGIDGATTALVQVLGSVNCDSTQDPAPQTGSLFSGWF